MIVPICYGVCAGRGFTFALFAQTILGEVSMAAAEDALKRRLSIAEYEQLPHDDGYRDELVRGWLVREPIPAEEHAGLEIRLGRRLDEFVEANGLGVVLGCAGYILEEDPPTVRGPDLSYIAQERLTGYPARRFRRLAPDLAVEIVSPSNRLRDLRQKAQQFLAAGTRMVWVIDPIRRRATVYRAGIAERVLSEQDELDGEDVLAGFRLSLANLFRT